MSPLTGLAALPQLSPRRSRGGVVLAHNSVNAAERLKLYLEFVRDGRNLRASVNVIFDAEGLEVSVR